MKKLMTTFLTIGLLVSTVASVSAGWFNDHSKLSTFGAFYGGYSLGGEVASRATIDYRGPISVAGGLAAGFHVNQKIANNNDLNGIEKAVATVGLLAFAKDVVSIAIFTTVYPVILVSAKLSK